LRVADAAVVDASPLIFLARSRHLDLLQGFAQTVWVPEPVATEIRRRGRHDVTVQAIETTSWLATRPAPGTPAVIREWRLGAGESSTLALAHAHNLEAILDDLAGRRCAASLGIPVRGTLGIVPAARQRGQIPSARPVIEDLMVAGLYLSRRVLDQALRRVGE
jgi:predicted nucleic acid-binding protein